MFSTGGIPHGCGHAVRTVYKGVRTTAADYIMGENQKVKPNITIRTNTFVDRLIIEDREGSLTATGVELATLTGEKHRILAQREVILSSGVYGSPTVLMRSGIGSREEIEKHGIECILELPGVGKNLMDHLVRLAFAL